MVLVAVGGINLDDVGYYKGRVAYSMYNYPLTWPLGYGRRFLFTRIWSKGAWYQVDHGPFLMKRRRALTMTSKLVAELMAATTHTPRDMLELVNTT
jgi:hypothetical protein